VFRLATSGTIWDASRSCGQRSNQIRHQSLPGNAFEFLRNGDLNARDFFAAQHDTLKRNQFGGTIGGPIKKDKLFGFFGYQGTRTRTASSIAHVPTQAVLNGDFTQIESAACQSSARRARSSTQRISNRRT